MTTAELELVRLDLEKGRLIQEQAQSNADYDAAIADVIAQMDAVASAGE